MPLSLQEEGNGRPIDPRSQPRPEPRFPVVGNHRSRPPTVQLP